MIECALCKKSFKRITNTHLIKNHNITQKEYLEKYGKIHDEELSKEVAKLISKSLKGKKPSDEALQKQKDFWNSEKGTEIKIIQSERMKKNNPMFDMNTREIVSKKQRENGENLGKTIHEFYQTEYGLELRKNQSERMKKNNPMFDMNIVIKSTNGHNRKKSGIEKKFETLLDKNILIEYVGNNKLWIEGKNPDYKIIGKNKVIEITSSCYNRTVENYDKKRIEHFEKNGYRCLCIWIEYIPKYKTSINKDFLNKKIFDFIEGDYSSTIFIGKENKVLYENRI